MTSTEVIERLRTIYDPEIPVNIYDLGLIYDVQVIGADAYVLMTLTTASCPAAAFLPEEVKTAVSGIPGLNAVHVDITYEPRWTQARMSEEARAQLGFS
ncbi:iron-sulfur cluster assembly protein [Flaviaesturariibacter terrae]